MPANGGGGGGGQGPMGGLRSGPGRLSHLAVVPETDPFRYPGGRGEARLQLGGCARGREGRQGRCVDLKVRGRGRGRRCVDAGGAGSLRGHPLGTWRADEAWGARAQGRPREGAHSGGARRTDHTPGCPLGASLRIGSTPIPAINKNI